MYRRLLVVCVLVAGLATIVLASGSPQYMKRPNGTTFGIRIHSSDTLRVDGTITGSGFQAATHDLSLIHI